VRWFEEVAEDVTESLAQFRPSAQESAGQLPEPFLTAIGGVNQKVEGFYRTCKLGQLTGNQGVIIPESNVRNLMLSREVVQSVREGRFHVWSAKHIDQGIELLTGTPAGERRADGRFPERTVHALVEERLERFARAAEEERADGHD